MRRSGLTILANVEAWMHGSDIFLDRGHDVMRSKSFRQLLNNIIFKRLQIRPELSCALLLHMKRNHRTFFFSMMPHSFM